MGAGALSASTLTEFGNKLRAFARKLAREIAEGRYDEQAAAYRLADALFRAARRGAAHPEWFGNTVSGEAVAPNAGEDVHEADGNR